LAMTTDRKTVWSAASSMPCARRVLNAYRVCVLEFITKQGHSFEYYTTVQFASTCYYEHRTQYTRFTRARKLILKTQNHYKKLKN